jgi:hypothetical protein
VTVGVAPALGGEGPGRGGRPRTRSRPHRLRRPDRQVVGRDRTLVRGVAGVAALPRPLSAHHGHHRGEHDQRDNPRESVADAAATSGPRRGRRCRRNSRAGRSRPVGSDGRTPTGVGVDVHVGRHRSVLRSRDALPRTLGTQRGRRIRRDSPDRSTGYPSWPPPPAVGGPRACTFEAGRMLFYAKARLKITTEPAVGRTTLLGMVWP